jgi:hypothetical protein
LKRHSGGDSIHQLADAKMFLQPHSLSLKAHNDSAKTANVEDKEKMCDGTDRQ